MLECGFETISFGTTKNPAGLMFGFGGDSFCKVAAIAVFALEIKRIENHMNNRRDHRKTTESMEVAKISKTTQSAKITRNTGKSRNMYAQAN